MIQKESRKDPIQIRLLSIMAILSGGCALAYEVLFMRALTVVCGDMFYVHAALLGTFLIGIGIGARLAFKYVRWLFLLEFITGLYAVVLPFILKTVAERQALHGISASPLSIVFATAGLVFIPSLCIGFTIPLFSAYIKERSPDTLSFQSVYIVYNMGAFLSIFVVEFLLVRYCGIKLSLILTGGINIFNGIVLFLMRAAPPEAPVEKALSFPVRILIALALASFCSSIFQMFFLKLSNLLFHPHRENFALGLAVILLGMFLGSLLAARIKVSFEDLLVSGALLVGMIYMNYASIAALFRSTLPLVYRSELLIICDKFLFGCLFALLPMICFGALIPAIMRNEKEVAGESGRLLFISSVANAAGYLFYVFIGHPFFTAGVLLTITGTLLLITALLVVRFSPTRYQFVLILLSVIFMLILIIRWKDAYYYIPECIGKLKPGDKVDNFKNGAESVTLFRNSQFAWISYNGFPSIVISNEGKVSYAEIETAVIAGLNAPRLDKALVIGFGTGITSGAAALIFKSLDVVEINGAFYDMMPEIAYANMDIEHNRRASLYLADARVFLKGSKREYDVIICSVSTPTYYAASKLYTVEFYKNVSQALKPDGTFCIWLSIPDMSEEGVRIILSALRKEFQYCQLCILRGMYYQATCSNKPIKYVRYSDLTLSGNLHESLQSSLPCFNLDELFDDIRISDNIFAHYVPWVLHENTDDHPVLEFEIMRFMQQKKMGKDLFCEEQELFNIDPVRLEEIHEPDRLIRRAWLFDMLSPQYFEKSFLPVLKKDKNLVMRYLLWQAQVFFRNGDHKAAYAILNKILAAYPDSAEGHNLMGRVLQSLGSIDDARSHYKRALVLMPEFEEARKNLDSLRELENHFRKK